MTLYADFGYSGKSGYFRETLIFERDFVSFKEAKL